MKKQNEVEGKKIDVQLSPQSLPPSPALLGALRKFYDELFMTHENVCRKGTSAWKTLNGFTLTLRSPCNNSKYIWKLGKLSPEELSHRLKEGPDNRPKTISQEKHTNKLSKEFAASVCLLYICQFDGN